jgi:hypothetical protein
MEIWKQIVGYENLYEISDLGRIRSLPKKGCSKLSFKKTTKDFKLGYEMVQLYKNNKSLSFRVHTLVVKTFLGITSNRKKVINHKDGVKTNNQLKNLEVVSAKENVKHAISLGLNPIRFGNSLHNTKIKEEDLQNIVKLKKEKVSNKDIAKIYNVSPTTISRIISGKRRSLSISIPKEITEGFISEDAFKKAIKLIKENKSPYYIEQKTGIGRRTKKMKTLMMIYAEQYGNILK